jgi:hypothetical protein
MIVLYRINLHVFNNGDKPIFCDAVFNFVNIYYVKFIVQIVDCSQSIWIPDHWCVYLGYKHFKVILL